MKLADIKVMKNNAMKERQKDVTTLLGVLIGAIETEMKLKPKDMFEQDLVLNIIRSQHKKALQTFEYDKSPFAKLYVDILEALLPRQINEEEMRVMLVAHNFENIGQWMKFLKEHYPNRYDGKLAAKVFNEK